MFSNEELFRRLSRQKNTIANSYWIILGWMCVSAIFAISGINVVSMLLFGIGVWISTAYCLEG